MRVFTTAALGAVGLGMLLALTSCKKSPRAPSDAGDASQNRAADASPAVQEPVTLRVDWEPGRRYRQVIAMTNFTEMFGAGGPVIRQEVRLVQDQAISVIAEAAKRGRELDLVWKDLALHLVLNGVELVRANSRTPTNNIGSPPDYFRHLLNAHLKFHFDSSNRLDNVEGLEDLRRDALKNVSPEAQQSFDGMFSEDYFGHLIDYARDWPETPVKPGDSWTVRTHLAMGALGTLTIDTRFTFRRWDRSRPQKSALLEFTGTIESTNGPSHGPFSMTMRISEGKIQGRAWYVPELRHVAEQEINQNMTLLIQRKKIPGYTTNAVPIETVTNLMTQKIHITLSDAGATTASR